MKEPYQVTVLVHVFRFIGGCRACQEDPQTREDRRMVSGIHDPGSSDWMAAARDLRMLGAKGLLDEKRMGTMLADALLCTQARSLGARLVTTDPDFALLRRAQSLDLEIRSPSTAHRQGWSQSEDHPDGGKFERRSHLD